jgi:putative solute:sodium symporter small subunit
LDLLDQSVNENSARDRYEQRTLVLALAVLGTMFTGLVVIVAAATDLNQYRILRFPLGFYLLAQGLIFAIVAAAFWFAHRQDRNDQDFSESQGL